MGGCGPTVVVVMVEMLAWHPVAWRFRVYRDELS
jgi:hypothetical protein